MAMTIGILNFHADMLTVPINDISDISMTDSTNDELNNDHCYVCLCCMINAFMKASVIHVQIIYSNSKLIAQFAGAKYIFILFPPIMLTKLNNLSIILQSRVVSSTSVSTQL